MMAARATISTHTLQSLLQGFSVELPGESIPVKGITSDSRKVQQGSLFLAYQIRDLSNITYIKDAIRAGATAIVVDKTAVPENFICPVPLVRIENLYGIIGILADRFYNQPSAEMTVIGVTGTNGKTSVSHILSRALTGSTGKKTGIIGTLGYGLLDHLHSGPNTTPEATLLQEMLASLRDENADYVVLEVSSHGIDQQRIAGVHFDTALLTNVSRDHLDYHSSLENYAAAKRRLFTDYGIQKAIVNLDDKLGCDLASTLPDKIELAGYTVEKQNAGTDVKTPCVYGQIRNQQLDGMQILVESPWGDALLKSRLFGKHNASNLLAALTALCLQGIPLEDSIISLEQCSNVPGRLECYTMADDKTAVVDYAHSPDALRNVLQTLKQICPARLACVFGCGGERDKGKRAEMGAIAASFADTIILTNDNPRKENPEEIIADIKKGIANHENITVITDRKEAIRTAISNAGAKDIILVAGKGHETYQDINGQKIPFSDRQVIHDIPGVES